MHQPAGMRREASRFATLTARQPDQLHMLVAAKPRSN